MHVVATGEYLDCEDLCPAEMTCLDVDCDLSLADLQAAGGYGYVAFLVYNVEEVMSAEFLVTGWPTGEGSPGFQGPQYCLGPEGDVLGEPFEKNGGVGGAMAFPCQSPCTSLYCLCRIAFGPSVLEWLPITLEYAPSQFGCPGFPHNHFLECGPDQIECFFEEQHGAVIGGECELIPNCYPGPSEADSESWGAVKAMYR